jgi:hypothetical protein
MLSDIVIDLVLLVGCCCCTLCCESGLEHIGVVAELCE